MSIDRSCMNFDGDEDCNKCGARGYIYSCPENCPDYLGSYPSKKSTNEDET